MIEVLKQALDALETEVSIDWTNNDEFNASAEKMHDAITSLQQAIKELESQDNNPIKDGWKLSFANGHSGYGVYAHMEEYPEDGAFLLLPIKELESQEPVGWHLIEALYPQGERLDIRMGDGSILCNLLPQADGDLWWEGSGTGEKFIDPVYADVTHWRVHSDTHPSQRTWVGLTDEEIKTICLDNGWDSSWQSLRFAQVIEAKLKERNI